MPAIYVPERKFYTPTNKIQVTHHTFQGVHRYEDDEIWGPDTDIGRSCVLNMRLYDPPVGNDTIAFDRSRYQNHGTIVGSPTWSSQGRVFDGVDDQIISAASTAFEVTASTGFTLGCWVNKTAANQSMLGVGLSNNPTQSQRIELWVQLPDANNNAVRVFSADGGGSATITAISAGVSHHLVVSQLANATGNNCLVYLDGVLYASVAVVGYPTWTAGTIKACLGNNANSLPFKGTYGEGFAFNRGLSAQEIQQDYNVTQWRYQ